MTSCADEPEADVHIVDEPNGPTRCGLTKHARYPYLRAESVQMHIDGRNMPVCATCAAGGWPDQHPPTKGDST